MLNKPKFMKPSANKEECTVDINADEIPFSCIVDGNEAITAWQIVIYDINDDKKVYDTGEITLDPSFYPVDEKNRNVVFTKDLKMYPNIIAEDSNTEKINSFINRADAYYWTITFTGSSGNSVTSYQEVFYANETPVPNLSYKYQSGSDYFPLGDNNTLTSRICTFKAEYKTNDGVQLKRYGWRISDKDSGQVFIDTISKNQIYGSADNIICTYDGFLNNGNYSLELFIETQNNTKITTSRSFSISYESTFLTNDFKVESLQNEPAIILDWNKSVVISGVLKDDNENIVSVGDTSFRINYPVDNQCSIEIPDKFKVVYENSSLNIDENSYIALSAQLLDGTDTTVFFAEGLDDSGNAVKRKLSYIANNGEFEYAVGGYDVEGQKDILKNITYEASNKPSPYVWYIFFMSPLVKDDNGNYNINLNVIESVVENCIYPKDDLYPDENFYPTFGNWNKLKGE